MSLWVAMKRAAVAWRGEVLLVQEGIVRFRMAPSCSCHGDGVVPVAYELRGSLRWNFVPCVCTIKRRRVTPRNHVGASRPSQARNTPGEAAKSQQFQDRFVSVPPVPPPSLSS